LPESPHPSRNASAAAGSAAFLLLAPGVVAGVVPWLLTGWRIEDAPLSMRIAGGTLIALASPSWCMLLRAS
jgi:hypothetical protein